MADKMPGRAAQSLSSVESLNARSYSRAPPDPPRSLTVVPLTRNQRYYGETPRRLRCGPRDGPVQGWTL